MECLQVIKDSVETSVSIHLFSSLKISSYYHIFKSKLIRFPLSKCRELQNFNPDRLSKDPYPKEDRPRGQRDLDSVLHHRRMIRQHGHTEPIWLALKKGEYTLLDGAHRIVSTYLENKRTIQAYIVEID
jgi:ParB-like nuclease domain